MDDLNKMKVTELKQALKDRGLPLSGTKPDLVKRLAEALGTTTTADSSDTGLEDSVQDIDDDDILNEDTDLPIPKKTSADEPAPTQTALAEKEVLIPSSTETNATNGDSESKQTDESDEKVAKPAEVSKLSDAERLKLRAEKFGVVSADAKKVIRAQRFGLEPVVVDGEKPGSEVPVSGKLGSKKEDIDLDKLKKRAERFGSVVSTSLTKVDEDERKRKRAERFGGLPAVSKSTSSIVSSDEVEAKKKKRAERFGIAT